MQSTQDSVRHISTHLLHCYYITPAAAAAAITTANATTATIMSLIPNRKIN